MLIHPLLVKSSVSLLFAGVLVGVPVALADHFASQPQHSTNIIIVSTPTQITLEQNKIQSYSCSLNTSPQTTAPCKLVKLDITNNWTNVKNIRESNSTADISIDDLSNPNHYFKLEVNKDFFDLVNLTSKKSISLVTSESSTPTTLEAFLKINGNSVDYVQATHLLGKAVKTMQIAETTPTSQKTTCSYSWPNSFKADCDVIAFGATTVTDNKKYTDQVPADLTTPITTIQANKYHLVHLKTEQQRFNKDQITSEQKIHMKKSTDTDWNNLGTLTDLAPVIVKGTGEHSVAFILDPYPIS